MKTLLEYFPDLTSHQIEQFEMLEDLYNYWNSRINVISRKDIGHLYEKHVLHSLAIAKWIDFKSTTKILDVGCGGGFPGIPLAIYFPEVSFHLVDSLGKKIKVVKDVIDSITLKNCHAEQVRAEKVEGNYDFIISRAVAKIAKLISWNRKNMSSSQKNSIPNGFILLKGGDLSEEIKPLGKIEYIEQIPIYDFFPRSYFQEKYLVYIQG